MGQVEKQTAAYTKIEAPRGRWIVSGLTKQEAESRYLNKVFRVTYSQEAECLVIVNDVRIYGGVVLTFCKLVRVLRGKVTLRDGEQVWAGRLHRVS